MKKLLILFFLLCLAVSVYGSECVVVVGQAVSAGGGCDDCSGALVLGAHFENNADIEEGTPCGCSDDTDKTWDGGSYNAESSDGSYSLVSTNSTTFYNIDLTNATTLEDEGTATFDLYLTENAGWNWPVVLKLHNGADMIEVAITDSNDLRLRHARDGWGEGNVDRDANLSLSTWYSVEVQWNVSGDPNTLSINVDGGTATTDSDTIYGSWGTNITDVGVAAGGDPDDVTFYLDNLQISTGSDLP